MTDRIAAYLALIILAALAVDVVMFGMDHLIFLGKKLTDLIEWLAVWR